MFASLADWMVRVRGTPHSTTGIRNTSRFPKVLSVIHAPLCFMMGPFPLSPASELILSFFSPRRKAFDDWSRFAMITPKISKSQRNPRWLDSKVQGTFQITHRAVTAVSYPSLVSFRGRCFVNSLAVALEDALKLCLLLHVSLYLTPGHASQPHATPQILCFVPEWGVCLFTREVFLRPW